MQHQGPWPWCPPMPPAFAGRRGVKGLRGCFLEVLRPWGPAGGSNGLREDRGLPSLFPGPAPRQRRLSREARPARVSFAALSTSLEIRKPELLAYHDVIRVSYLGIVFLNELDVPPVDEFIRDLLQTLLRILAGAPCLMMYSSVATFSPRCRPVSSPRRPPGPTPREVS